jgi:glycolate oxidase FAD binding subunit
VSEAEIAPQDLAELRQVIAQSPRVLPIGNGTKRPLCHAEDAIPISLRNLRGIIEYEPSEFTFTAWAGTPLSEIVQTLRDRRQYLPFDPPLVDAGATLGGTVASGLSGPGRFRFGGVRDFVIGVKLLAGDGQLVQGGGKVVKNAAGFDLPKFLVGSLGRYGLMTELSFKVFPQPPATLTLKLSCGSHQEAMQRLSAVAASRWEADALDYRPSDQVLAIRLAGPEPSNDEIAEEILSTWPGGEREESGEADHYWRSVTDLNWSGMPDCFIVKVPTTSKRFLGLQAVLEDREGVSIHLSVAGGVTWIAVRDMATLGWLDGQLKSQQLAGLVVLGDGHSPRVGSWPDNEMQRAVKQAMDPDSKFAGI